MASEFSSKLAADCLEVFFADGTATNFTGTPSLFVALTSGQTAVDGSISGEISGFGYARVSCSFDTASVTENTGTGSASIQNNGDIVFTGFTGTIASVDGFAICASGTETASDALCYGSISTIQIDNGDTVTFADDAITISLD